MSRIAGVVYVSKDAVKCSLHTKLYDLSWKDVGGIRRTWCSDNAAFGHLHIAPSNPELKSAIGDFNAHLTWCGSIVDAPAYPQPEPGAGRQNPPNTYASYLLDILASERYTLLADINGVYSAALWQPNKNRLTLASDRLGFRPLYYCHDINAQMFIFSSDLRGVASIISNRKINWQAASTFLHFGHHLGDATWFENVYVMPPGSVLVFENNSVRFCRYWDISKISMDESMTPDKAVHGIIDAFKLSIRRRHEAADMPEAVFLSGGIDSRRIAAELSRQGVSYATYTTRGFNPSTADKNLARVVSEMLNVPNTYISLPPTNFLDKYWPKCNFLLDYETNLHQWMLPLVESFPTFYGHNYDGIGGDILVNGILRSSGFAGPEGRAMLSRMTRQQLALYLVGGKRDYSIFDHSLRRRLSHDSVISAVETELGKYQLSQSCLTLFYFLNRTRRAIALSPMRLIGRRLESFLPYLDNDFLEFVLSIPMAIRMDHPLRRESLDRAYPELAIIDATNYTGRKYRYEKVNNEINYDKQRRAFFLKCIKEYYIRNNWIFSNAKSFPMIIKDLLMRFLATDHISYIFDSSNEVFYEFLLNDLNKEPSRNINEAS